MNKYIYCIKFYILLLLLLLFLFLLLFILLLLLGDDKTVKVWNSTTGDCINTLQGHTSPVNSVAFSPDGTRIVSGSKFIIISYKQSSISCTYQ